MADLAGIVGAMRLSGVVITALSVAGIYWLARPLLGAGPAFLGARAYWPPIPFLWPIHALSTAMPPPPG